MARLVAEPANPVSFARCGSSATLPPGLECLKCNEPCTATLIDVVDGGDRDSGGGLAAVPAASMESWRVVAINLSAPSARPETWLRRNPRLSPRLSHGRGMLAEIRQRLILQFHGWLSGLAESRLS